MYECEREKRSVSDEADRAGDSGFVCAMDENIFLSYRAGRTETEMGREERSKGEVERRRGRDSRKRGLKKDKR